MASGGAGPGKGDVGPSRDRKCHLDQVKLDGVMKELVRNQKKAEKRWATQWEFMNNPRRYWEAEAKRRGLPDDIFERANLRRKPQEWSVENKLKVPLKECEDVPTLSSGMIGWRAKHPENHIDLLAGPMFISPKQTMNPPLGPTEPDPKKQYFIFLG